MDNYQGNFVVAGNKEIDESETLECQVCHAIMRQITHKHLKRHKMTTEEYKLKFPSHPLMTAYRRSFY